MRIERNLKSVAATKSHRKCLTTGFMENDTYDSYPNYEHLFGNRNGRKQNPHFVAHFNLSGVFFLLFILVGILSVYIFYYPVDTAEVIGDLL